MCHRHFFYTSKIKSPITFYMLVLGCVCLSFLALLTGCTVKKKSVEVSRQAAMQRVSFFGFPNCLDDMAYNGLESAILHSLAYLERRPATEIFEFGKDHYDTLHMIRSLKYFFTYIQTNPSKADLKKFIHSNYRIYRAAGQDYRRKVLFTGYYEPILHGNLERSDQYPVPVYGRPNDLLTIDLSPFSSKFKGERIIARWGNQTLLPYHDRNDIDFENALTGKASVISWLSNRIDLFFLHIQGSGKIALENGKTLHVHYHTTNGRPYRSIGKLLMDEGRIPRSEMSMQSIRSYLKNHPEEIQRILTYNPSYVFFQIRPDGPLGALEEKLTPSRSIATDLRLFPKGALAFIETQKPLVDGQGRIEDWTDMSRFVLNQDTGGAIRGPARADIFWGNGSYAEIAAGHLQHSGKLYFLVLKPEKRKKKITLD